jgi:hypothetical protein
VARTRGQRRRASVIIAVGLVLTLLAVYFVRDVTRVAHQSPGSRSSENRSFSVLANALIAQQNTFDGRLTYLVSHGSTLSRVVFSARLAQLERTLPGWYVEAQLLRSPTLAHHVNDVLSQLTLQRVNDYETILSSLAASLVLPWNAPHQPSAHPVEDLAATAATWGRARYSLIREPGLVRLDALSDLSGAAVDHWAPRLAVAPSLVLHRSIYVSAVQVEPAPLPSAIGRLLLAPATALHLGVTVSNGAYVDQSVSLRVSITPTNGFGHAHSRELTAVLAPLGSFAFIVGQLGVVAGETAVLRIAAIGAPATVGQSAQRTYQVTVSPSGATSSG